MAAASLPSFRTLMESDAGVVGIVPGQGWSVAHLDGGALEPILAWAVDRSGYGAPLTVTSEGYAEPHAVSDRSFFVPPGVAPEDSPYRWQSDTEER
ncbi:hypothetical protein [Streptomyces hydrogenans]